MLVLIPLVFGLLSWGLGLTGIFQKLHRRRILCACLSFACCCVSLYFCLYTIDQWVQIEDISAILDCTGAYRFCAAVLIGGTLLLNLLSVIRDT